MKPDQVDKLYSKLTPHEQAALFFEAEVRRDHPESEIINDSVPMQSIQRKHNDYCDRVQGFWYLAGFYGITYWRTRELRSIALMQTSAVEYEKYYPVFCARLGSLDAALIDVCGRLNVDIESVKTLAMADDEPSFAKYAQADLVDEYTEQFLRIIKQ